MIVLLEDHGDGETVMVLDPQNAQEQYTPDDKGCAAVPLEHQGVHEVRGYYSCTQTASYDWKGASELVEIYIPYDQSACA